MKLQFYKDGNGQHRWRLLDGKIVVGRSSGGWGSRKKAKDNATRVMDGLVGALRA